MDAGLFGVRRIPPLWFWLQKKPKRRNTPHSKAGLFRIFVIRALAVNACGTILGDRHIGRVGDLIWLRPSGMLPSFCTSSAALSNITAIGTAPWMDWLSDTMHPVRVSHFREGEVLSPSRIGQNHRVRVGLDYNRNAAACRGFPFPGNDPSLFA
jgi:hypothetical protein